MYKMANGIKNVGFRLSRRTDDLSDLQALLWFEQLVDHDRDYFKHAGLKGTVQTYTDRSYDSFLGRLPDTT